MNIKLQLIKFIKFVRDRQNNRMIWEILFAIEQLIIGGKNRKHVIISIVKRVRTVIGFYLPSPYRPKGVIHSVE